MVLIIIDDYGQVCQQFDGTPYTDEKLPLNQNINKRLARKERRTNGRAVVRSCHRRGSLADGFDSPTIQALYVDREMK